MNRRKNLLSEQEMREIASRIKAVRTERGFSFQDLATITHMSKSTLQRYETGGIKNIPLSLLNVLAGALGVTPEWIMGWDEAKSDGSVPATEKKAQERPEPDLDDFAYAMHNESKNLTDDDKALLLSMAKKLGNARKD